MNWQTRLVIQTGKAEGLDNEFIEQAQEKVDDYGRKELTEYMAREIEERFFEDLPEMSDFMNDLVTGALNEVDWMAYATAIMEDVDYPMTAQDHYNALCDIRFEQKYDR
jgi:hypothetical protein